MTKIGVSRSQAVGSAAFFTVAILFSSGTVLAVDKPLQLDNCGPQAVAPELDVGKLAWVHGTKIEMPDKDYPHVIE
ncbi:MAG: hypothetical protein OER98_11785 [Gammaproteobacteria bacterium]|nr:hypothetical protein [Gammaproteobacteria bacterium]